jgi:putative transposase
MPYRKQQFVNGEIYHVTTRRIEDNLLFKNIGDYYRGIFSIYEFNNSKPVTIRERRALRSQIKARRDPTPVIDDRKLFVQILTFCLMPNHIHLLLRQLQDEGISKFMQKFGAGYSAYFKNKYKLERKGYFYQGRFVSVPIETDDQLKNIFVYIHTNSISLIEPKWKEIGIKDPEKVIKYVEDYKWSSYLDYIGKKNFPSVTERDFMLKIMGGEQGCRDFVEHWIRYKGEIREFVELSLE